MNLFQDRNFKLKYHKSKYKVKIWESEFRKLHGHNPSKIDIRSAAPNIREAYKAYYKLKTRVLEDLDILLTDEFDGIDISDLSEAQQPVIPLSCNKAAEQCDKNKSGRIVLADIQNGKETADIIDDSIMKKKCQLKEDSLKQSVDNTNGVWGTHLNKETVITSSQKIKSLQQRSSSCHFTEKLLQGAKFNKRNPRKSLSSLKSNKANKSNINLSQDDQDPESLSVSLPTLPTSQSSDNNLLEPLQSVSDIPPITFSDEKYRVIQKSAPVSNHSISAIQKVLTSGGQNLHQKRKFDEGWIDRCTKLNFLNDDKHQSNNSTAECSQPKNLVSYDSNAGSTVSESVNNVSTVADSDEDVVYSSDSEGEYKQKGNKNESIYPSKRKFSAIENRQSLKSINETNEAKKPRLEITSQIVPESLHSNNMFEELQHVNVDELADKIIKNDDKRVKVKKKLSKKEVLEKKVATGQANENFVRINLKKKVYVRGKKNTNYSKYKKMQWKKKKKNGVSDDFGCDGLLKCFSCGDVGHFARNCNSLKGENLLPADDEEEEESSFPTLDEVARMAAESTIPNNRRPLFTETKLGNTDEKNSGSLGKSIPLYVIDALNSVESNVQAVQPLYELTSEGLPRDTPKEVHDALKLFGHEKFRPGQEEAVMRILSGLSTLVTLSTGSGKSLCYQLPAYLFSRKSSCLTLVVSPLVSLMEDQVMGVAACIQAACLHTNQSPKQRENVIELAKSGNLNILLVSPEAVVSGERSKGFGSILKELPPIAFACIDEVHCVSQWSHNFRPSYLMICKVLREKLGVKTILGLTATATKTTCASIVEHLTIPDGERGVIKDTPLPSNLVLSVSKDARRDEALIALLSSTRFKNCHSIIIYCTRREECERVAVLIRTYMQDFKKPETTKARSRISWNAEPYHAGLSAARRKLVQKHFMSGELRIVVATVAFGMGINKHDIRGIIHYNMPRNFESYVQEVGRAGRNGLLAHCHLFLDSQGGDRNELRRHIYANSVERHVIRKLLQRVFIPCKCVRISEMLEGSNLVEEESEQNETKLNVEDVKCPGHEVAFTVEDTVRALDLPEENISTLLCYLELHPKKLIKVLSPVYTLCKVQSYNGHRALKAAAKLSPPLAMAFALDQRRGISHENSNKIEFPVVDIAAALSWDSGLIKNHLKKMEWQKVNDKWRRTGLVVEFSCLGFRVRAPGNLQPSELDEALDSLHEHVDNQEQTCLQQLQVVFNALTSVAHSTYSDCSEEADVVRSDHLKTVIRDYFKQETLNIELPEQTLACEEQVIADIRQLVCSYRENVFTGRAVARIFHGIASPCFPAQIWGRCRYWRSHLHDDFKLLSKVASKEILQLR